MAFVDAGSIVRVRTRARHAVPLRILAFALVVSASCSGTGRAPRPPLPAPLDTILDDVRFDQLLATAEEHRLQILIGTIIDGPDGKPRLEQIGFRADAEYFYPASTVKLFGAIAALETLDRLSEETGLELTIDTPLAWHPQFEETEILDRDETNVATQAITLRHEIRKLFLVSDNESFNKTYEFVGQDDLAASLERAGLHESHIVHRLSEFRTPEQNRATPQIDFLNQAPAAPAAPAAPTDGTTATANRQVLFSLPSRFSRPLPKPIPVRGIEVGNGYVSGDETIHHPMDFSEKNRVSLHDLQRGLCKLVRPDVDCGPGGHFELTPEHRDFLRRTMAELPRESRNPLYPVADYPDTYGKNLLAGIDRVLPRERFRILNKTGQAYGFTLENAWIEDTASGAGFFLTAVVSTNDDGILNDDRYDYATVATPFFTALGERAARWFWPPSP
jgi:hypothetical protein